MISFLRLLNAYYNAVNKVASQNISETSNKLKKYLDNFESKRLNKSDNDDDFTLYIYSIKTAIIIIWTAVIYQI